VSKMGKGYCPYCNNYLGDGGFVKGYHKANCPLGQFDKQSEGSKTDGWEMNEGTGFTRQNYFVHVVPNSDTPIPTGWACPRCGKIWAPTVRMCESCNPPYTIVTWPPYETYKEYPYGTTTDAKDSSTQTDSPAEGKISCYFRNQ